MRGSYLRSSERMAALSGWDPEARDLQFFSRLLEVCSNRFPLKNQNEVITGRLSPPLTYPQFP